MESIVRSIAEKKIINTGFLIGPFCPIYGIGAIIMFLFLESFQNSIITLFLISIIILTLWEYFVGVFLEKVFKTKYWDYSDQKFNFQGRICLVNSLCWGVLGVLFVKYIHPFVQNVISQINITFLGYFIVIVSVVVIIDIIISVVKVKNIKTTLNKIEEINSEIKEKLKEMKVQNKEHTSKDSVQEVIEELKKKRNRIMRHLYRNVYRLKKAFPAINTQEITQVLNQKLEDIKNRTSQKKDK